MLIAAERSALDLDSLIEDADEAAIAAITIAELGVGLSVASGRRKVARQAFLDDVLSSIPIIEYDLSVALAHTDLLVAARETGRPRGAHDMIIAATAVASNRTVVTSDQHGFAGLPGVVVRRPA